MGIRMMFIATLILAGCGGGGGNSAPPAGGSNATKQSAGYIYTVAGISFSIYGVPTYSGNNGPIGDNGPATSAIMTPTGVAVDSVGNLYISDTGNHRIRMVVGG